ncbi:MAG: YbaB/EbfC family nucleoid-associated protein [Desulfobulbus sp.]|nr:MAG: YbaB/EbfC family nucleoid-associated protein [Desulfobulbus sp.]RUM37641.1 MAG: YbaB/EbfC family nucleoid-associated protein [Desulfobulbus sp.]RUM38392.1 MAG: YbaB/EbfC family nucleoid-associated protein [Desulfobulbus sp.]
MNISDMMKQAKQVQEKMATLQEELAGKMVTGTAGGGMVTATMNGRGELVGLAIEKDIVSPDDVQMLQDLIVAAVNDGARKAGELGKGEMAKLTGGMKIPGLS